MKTPSKPSTNSFTDFLSNQNAQNHFEIRRLRSIIEELKPLVYHPYISHETKAICAVALLDLTMRLLALNETTDGSEPDSR